MAYALVKPETKTVLGVWSIVPKRVGLPGVGFVDGATAGWEGHGYKIVNVTRDTTEPPEGQGQVGRAYTWNKDDSLQEVKEFGVKPAPKPPTSVRDLEKAIILLATRIKALEDANARSV